MKKFIEVEVDEYGPEPLDSAGRTEKQIKDMKKNAPSFPELAKADKAYAARIAKEQANYPRILYLSCTWKLDEEGEVYFPDGDKRTPNYHAYEEYRKGRTIQVYERMPWKTITVRDEAEEKAALKSGAVDSPAKLPRPWEEKEG